MRTIINISPDEEPTSGGGAPSGGGGEDVPRLLRGSIRTQGFLTLAFGFAMGAALILLSILITNLGISGPVTDVLTVAPPSPGNFAWVFLAGFVGGIVISLVYNMLVVNRLNLFGLESNAD